MYANTCINDGSDKSELLELFLRKDSFNNQKFSNLSDAVQYFKDDEKGVSEVCAVVEKYAKEYAKEEAIYQVIEALNNVNLSKEQILSSIISQFNLTREEAEAYYKDSFVSA